MYFTGFCFHKNSCWLVTWLTKRCIMSEISFICWNHMKAYLIFYMRTYIHTSWVGTGGERREEGLTHVYVELYVCTREYSWVITELFMWKVNRTKETLKSVENSLRWRHKLIKCKNIACVWTDVMLWWIEWVEGQDWKKTQT